MALEVGGEGDVDEHGLAHLVEDAAHEGGVIAAAEVAHPLVAQVCVAAHRAAAEPDAEAVDRGGVAVLAVGARPLRVLAVAISA